jgi:hypothetical protein
MRKCVFIFFLIVSVFSVKSQILNYNIEIDSIIMKNYGLAEYPNIVQDSVKYNLLKYYHTESFIIEYLFCTDCVKIDYDKFDILPFESLRQENTRYVRNYDKYGFKLTLLARSELLYLMPIQQP